jgi:spore germination protein KC
VTARRLKILILTLVILHIPINAGCWNRREPENLASILAIGLDYDDDSGQYEVLMEIVNHGAFSGGEGGGGSSQGMQPSQVFAARGNTPFEALRRAETIVPRELFWAHTEVMVISETVARRGILPALDFLTRERQSRLIIFPLISSDQIRSILDAQGPLEVLFGQGLLTQIETIQRNDAVIPPVDLRILHMQLSQQGIDPFLPRARLVQVQQQSGQQQAGGRNSTSPANMVELNGGAAFRGDRMAGWLNNQATRGWHWITGEAFRGLVTFPCPCEGEEHFISVDIYQSYCSIEPQMADGRPKVKLDIKVEGRLQDLTCTDMIMNKENAGRILNNLLKEAVKEDVSASLGRARELGSDIFGFGRAFYRTIPRDWSSLKDNWEEHFRRLAVEVLVKATIRRTGMTVEQLKR